MSLHLKTKLYYLKKSLIYIKNYKRLSLLVVFFSLLGSLFDGASIGALIPFLQNLTATETITISFPFFENFQKYLFGPTRETALINLLLFALVMIILRSVFNYLRTVTIVKTGQLIKRDLESHLFAAITNSSLRLYQEMSSGNLVSSMASYTSSIVAFIFVLFNLITNISKLLVYFVLLLLISWKFTLIVITIELAFFPIIKTLINRIKNTGYNITQTVSNLYSRMIEMLQNIPLIKISGTESQETGRFSSLATNLALLEYKQSKQSSLLPFITEISVISGIIALLIISIHFLKLDIISQLPFIIAYLYVFFRLFNEVNVFLRSISGMFELAPAFKAYENNLNRAKNLSLPNGVKVIKTFQDKIEFKNVTFGYNPNYPILKNLNLVFPKGSFTAFIGSTGSGKTTIANLIAGLFLVDRGNILIDNIDIKDLDIHSWRSKIGYIPQDSIIFNDTAAANISYGAPTASPTDIEQAARLADIHDFLINLPDGYNTILGECGAKLSGGQRQRIAIARAIIRNPDILILDEATSSLDSETEKTIQDALEKASAGHTVIAIAHRLSTIQKADNIVTLSHGRVVEQGSHSELLAQNSIYKKYYALQFKN